MSAFDRVTEVASRWLAARTSRRTFLANAGKVAVLTAGGSALTSVFARRAEARVCGQSGVSPKCPTFDCVPPGFWGWCWYASPGCCANGGLKKICDCCRTGHPNVQGYCPAGSAVYCVVESCLGDPRVMRLSVERVPGATLAAMSLGRSLLRPAGSAKVVVLAESDPFVGAVAAPVAAHFGAALLLVDPLAPIDVVVAELKRLGAEAVSLIGLNVSEFERSLRDLLVPVERPSAQADIASLSVDIGNWLLARTGGRTAYCIGAGQEAQSLAPSVAAFASGDRSPVLVTAAAAGAIVNGAVGGGVEVIFVGAEAIEAAPPGATRVAGTATEISRAFATRAVQRAGAGSIALAVVPADGGFGGLALISPGGAVLLHPNGGLGIEQRDWCLAQRLRVARAEISQLAGPALTDQGLYDLQSAINGFDAHLLVGVSGDGLPVHVQPVEERALGKARVSGPLPPPQPTTLVSRGNPNRVNAGVGATASPAPTTTAKSSTVKTPPTTTPTPTPTTRKPGITTPVPAAAAIATTSTTSTPTTSSSVRTTP